jgi:hypothetical protein
VKFQDLTLMSCSFNTPLHTITMLKSFIRVHGDGPFNLLLMENSTNNETSDILDANNIKYIKNPGGTHSLSIDELIFNCLTKYALLVDSDVVFTKPIDKLLEVMAINDITLLGEICGDRGGYKIHNRVHPWFCLINIDNIKSRGIKWHDQRRIDDSKSQYFFSAIPINPMRGNVIPFYDNGCTFFEDVAKVKLNIVNAKGITSYFKHYEGSSWHRQSGHDGFIKYGNGVYEQFLIDSKAHESVDIKNKFITKDYSQDKILLIQPIFCPDDTFFEINKRSLISILEYLDAYKFYDIKLVFGGYCAKDEYFLKLEEITNGYNRRNISHITTVRIAKNYGKAYIVNKLFSDFYTNEKYLLTVDSDIVFDCEEYDILRRLINLANRIPEKFQNQLGFFALNQKDLCCHMWGVMDQNVKISNEILSWSSKYIGIAGGCLFINPKSFKEVGGYREMGVYSGDDGYLLADMNKRNFLNVISRTISIIHPKQNIFYNGEYQEWKHKQVNICAKKSGNFSKEDFEKIVEETEKQWKNRFQIDKNKKNKNFTIMASNLGEYSGGAKNRKERFIKAVDSFLNNTYKEKELIIVSDGCEDTIQLYENKYLNIPEIKCLKISKQNLFSGEVRNTGIKYIKSKANDGDFVCYLDTDDTFGKNHIKIIADNFINNDFVIYDNYDNFRSLDHKFYISKAEMVSGRIGTSSFAHRWDLDIVWPDGYGHDWVLLNGLSKKYKYSKIPIPEYYIQHHTPIENL